MAHRTKHNQHCRFCSSGWADFVSFVAKSLQSQASSKKRRKKRKEKRAGLNRHQAADSPYGSSESLKGKIVFFLKHFGGIRNTESVYTESVLMTLSLPAPDYALFLAIKAM